MPISFLFLIPEGPAGILEGINHGTHLLHCVGKDYKV